MDVSSVTNSEYGCGCGGVPSSSTTMCAAIDWVCTCSRAKARPACSTPPLSASAVSSRQSSEPAAAAAPAMGRGTSSEEALSSGALASRCRSPLCGSRVARKQSSAAAAEAFTPCDSRITDTACPPNAGGASTSPAYTDGSSGTSKSADPAAAEPAGMRSTVVLLLQVGAVEGMSSEPRLLRATRAWLPRPELSSTRSPACSADPKPAAALASASASNV